MVYRETAPLFTIHDSRPKRHPQPLQEGTSLLIISRRGNNRNIHPAQFIDLVKVNLRKYQLLADSDGVITAAIKRLRRNSPKGPDARQGNRHQPVQKFI